MTNIGGYHNPEWWKQRWNNLYVNPSSGSGVDIDSDVSSGSAVSQNSGVLQDVNNSSGSVNIDSLKKSWEDAKKVVEKAEKEYQEAEEAADLAEAKYKEAVNKNDANVEIYRKAALDATKYATAKLREITSAKIAALDAKIAYENALKS